ncbi:ADP-ribosylglycohydrolase family protein [Nocardia sp. 2]|uniref:ADP-ribosylglycohydrolase family protein n=1 Tax=Nocardia acididurans TaxID=2802282 RepID=A0ABS1LXR3_9NOCA|nr:ADP-ribosylglycohydrolase family protein [Nocardia acididurans]MBL1073004.1 ADP-ribosylglycohydrolase family protein [Nocardia acididurans]
MGTIETAFFGHHEADPRALLFYEWCQRRESGYAVDDFAEEVHELSRMERPLEKACWRLLDRIESAERLPEWRYLEWDDVNGAAGEPDSAAVSAEATAAREAGPLPPEELFDRVHGGWLGRAAGCTLGKPLENGFLWTPSRIRAYLEPVDAYPLTDYVPVRDPMPDGVELHWTWPESTRDHIDGCPRDDDLDYTVLGLHLLEQRGPDFTTDDVAALWLERLPFLQTYTAERVAYRNLIDGFTPPDTATFRNPYREWIGALIRADIYGYISPGDPTRAAALAARDASISHVGNGLWAAQWAAALVAAAFTADSPHTALTAAQTVVPARSRLGVALSEVMEDHRRGFPWDHSNAAIRARHGRYNWVHAIGNACCIAAGLLWGEGDFTRTIGLTVQAGWDTDSNGATAGSVAGILAGAASLPAHWTAPLHDRLRSSVAGYDGSSIADLARRANDVAVRFAH